MVKCHFKFSGKSPIELFWTVQARETPRCKRLAKSYILKKEENLLQKNG